MIVMTFGEWIRRLRKEQKLDIRTFAEQSGVEASTISRVENERTQVTLLIAIRLCDGLRVTVSDVLSEVYGVTARKSTHEEVPQMSLAPTMEDVEEFLRYFHEQKDEARKWLIDLLNKASLQYEHTEDAVNPTQPRFFGLEDIHKLLFASPFYRFELQYPPSLTTNDILTFHREGAMLTLTDIAEFTRKLRREKQVTLAKLEQDAKISQNMLSRLESSFIEQIKLADVFMLDEVLKQEGTLLKMYWSVYSFYQNLLRRSPSTADQEMKLASIFIIICRWLQIVSPRDDSWMKQRRFFEKLA